MTIICKVCDKTICKYEKDFKSTGAITIMPPDKFVERSVDICESCAKQIALELVEGI